MEKEYEEYLIQGQITEVKKSLFNFEGPNPKRYGGIAQLGEHLLCKQGVSGSIPLISTKSESPRHKNVQRGQTALYRLELRTKPENKWAYSSAG